MKRDTITRYLLLTTEIGMKVMVFKVRSVVLGLIVWCGLGSIPVLAQKWDMGADFMIGLPQNEFRDKIRGEGYGFSGHFGRFIGDSPIMIGADIGYLNYGTEERWEPIPTIPGAAVLVRTRNNIFMLHGFARVQPQEGRFRPFLEGLYGFKYLFTETSIKDSYGQTLASATNLDDLAASWGVGTGIDLRLWEGPGMKMDTGFYDICLSLSADYLWGSEAQYLKKGSIVPNPDGSVTYLVLRSKTDMLLPRVGLRLRF